MLRFQIVLSLPPGFTIFRSDREFKAVDKSKGGGLCFLINNRWCTNNKILSTSCTSDLETLVIQCRPFYLPREFPSLIFVAVYIPPDANTGTAIQQLVDIVPRTLR